MDKLKGEVGDDHRTWFKVESDNVSIGESCSVIVATALLGFSYHVINPIDTNKANVLALSMIIEEFFGQIASGHT